ncbi:uncharacterized protein MKK02DRAFT_22429 [Dioszegia hungarica]|uniref:Citrate transporter-like domain-containing protein n=1 Tax=Dioszegia hungarica TaxID=4972 RepID=A0AA38LY10_9TREE|nr:uncharacterized protein MKK02DRAFT_22429 [Dioszegia hungarica]KAI9638459.1 hypothetical protein MKK02DRAFT_22429 [Dioszegia hungarica]
MAGEGIQELPVDNRQIDARSIVTLIVFFVVNALVIFPLSIPLPYFLSNALSKLFHRNKSAPAAPRSTATKTPAATEPDEKSRTVVTAGASTETSASPAGARDVEREQEKAQAGAALSKRWHFTLGLETAPVIGVILLLAATCIDGEVLRDGIVGRGGVRPYDIMTLFISFAYIALSLDRTNLLRYLAFIVASKSASSGRKLYISFFSFFSLLGLIVGNDPLILSGTPFLAHFSRLASIPDSTAYLFTQFQTANLVSALLVSSNPTNLVLTSAFGISFLSYSAWLALPTIASLIVLFPVLRWVVFRKEGMIPRKLTPPTNDPANALHDPWGALIGGGLFLVTIICLIALSAVGKLEGVEGVWTVTAPAAILILIRDAVHDLMKRKEGRKEGSVKPTATRTSPTPSPSRSPSPAPTTASPAQAAGGTIFHRLFPTVTDIVTHLPLTLIPFAFAMFMLVESLQHTGWIRVWGGWWAAWADVGGVPGCVWLMGMISVIGCNIFGTNIGATVLLSRVLQQWVSIRSGAVSNRQLYGSVFALAVGSNFGAYSFVFPASLAGLLWRHLLKQKDMVITRKQFAKWNWVSLIVTMIVGCLVVAGEVCVMYES